MSDESLFREVDEEVRQEQYKKIWKQYGNLITAVAVLVVVGVAGFKGWQYWQLKQSEAAGDAFFAAVKLAGTGKTDEALAGFGAISHAGAGELARIRSAAVLADAGKVDDAVKAYDALAADGSADGATRDLARIRAALLLADKASPADLQARLKDFDAPGNGWRHIARELMAISQWKAGDYSAADATVKAIQDDPETPPGVRQHAKLLSDLLVPVLAKK